ncbi:hypothetical protein [Marinobacter salsuginis]|uniref:Uncharacterized protein n=1 Tax=Marinobacter salsuginis TaxID=418719 RepID=A0A5M3Q1S6_9GAMM|nr:hypothetical protein [Marinobacter salsuginis]GBO89215.1 hypothetical protein MSSD14B_28830 [Marinobacter salsuginis]|tara:strand:- start:12 stop:371 length:360 start_codon:yes stop_codon:yes gene_type:complete
MILTFRKFVKAKYDARPKLKTYYGSFETYFQHYFRNHRYAEWLETLRDSEPSLGFVNSIARNYIQLSGVQPREISQILAGISRQYNVEIPAVEGILTPEYWEEKAAQMHLTPNDIRKVA